MDNVAVTDLVPAGCEIENPRLRPSTELGWTLTNPLRIEYMDVRDDRIILFTSLDGGSTREFLYLLRVVNAGRFILPPIGAEAMYDPGFRSYHGAGTVTSAPMNMR